MIEFNKVFKSYNGKTGCMCGCVGKYSLPEHTALAEDHAASGWESTDESNVSNRRVRIAVNKLNRSLDFSHPVVMKMAEHGIFWNIDETGRNTTVYMK